MLTLKASYTVKPLEPSPTGLIYLSDFDQSVAITHAPLVYFSRPISDHLLNPIEILKNSLGKALTIFYPLAGRLQTTGRGRLEVNCNSMGALFSETESEAKICDFGDFTPTSKTRSLIPSVDYNKLIDELPLLLVQVTNFSCGGISLGLGISHVLVDGRCAAHFVSEWARIARGEEPENLPFLDRTVLKLEEDDLIPPRFDHLEFGKPPMLIGQTNNLEEQQKETTVVMLKLSKEHIQKLKKDANEFPSVYTSSKPFARYEAVTAHMWRCSSKARLHEIEQLTRAFLGNPNMVITSWIGLPLFGVDFGWGKEIYMGPGAMPFDGRSFIFPNHDEDGSFDVPFRLQVEHMDAFKKFFYENIMISTRFCSLSLSLSLLSLLYRYRTPATLASIASFSPSPRAQFHSPWKKPTKNLQYLIKPLITPNNNSLSIPNPNNKILSSSSSFPCYLKLPSLTASVPSPLRPVSDSTDESFVENPKGFDSSDQIPNAFPNLKQTPNGFVNLKPIPIGLEDLQTIPNGFDRISTGESVSRVFIEDPPWIRSLLRKDFDKKAERMEKLEKVEVGRKKCSVLMRRQIKAETEAWEKMVQEYKELERVMCEKELAPNLPYVKKLFLGWFEPLRAAIAEEQRTHELKKSRGPKWAPFMGLLTADKMAVIVMHKMMATLLSGQHGHAVPVAHAAIQVGAGIEQEVTIHSFFEKTEMSQSQKAVAPTEEGFCQDAELLRKRIKSLIKKKKITEVQKLVKDEEIKPWGRDMQAKLGCRLIQLLMETAYVQATVDQSEDSPPDVRPAFFHAYRSSHYPRKKVGKRFGVIQCDPLVLAGLEGTASYRYDRGGYFFLPSYLIRTHGSKPQQDAMKNTAAKQMQKIYEALDTLGNTKWRINKRVLSAMESIWAEGGNTGGLVDRKDVPIPEKPESEDVTEIKKWKWNVRKAKKVNQELYSQRCDTELKLSVACQMKDEDGFYYPHSLDFRGRAYPMHSHLNHLNSDICRGVLEFAEGRPLGKSGLRWLKIHLANIYGDGVEKLSHEGRLAFVENNLENVIDSADNPLHGNQWWLTAEDPFQCLAACISLSEALTSSAPHTVISHLPIHQDGSCNGLQHYAALGRDSVGAAAVNLVAGEKPADVYSEIAARVHDIMKRDSNEDPAINPNAILAKALVGQVFSFSSFYPF
ncbi:hypothetical protein RHMOL_Rhmol01G0022300 [Rhododendron molle]|uniref:Uncharacterized protein n=1 Tax=Rhododendron molle TaxID=49168 RepID=A0ACC0Q045_RHOML|nr:hypothetical protein RHMOL_Rhmol01G0022300 [Rhododendron molle]